MEKPEKQSKADKIREKIENLKFAHAHSDDPKNFMKMINEAEEQLRDEENEDERT